MSRDIDFIIVYCRQIWQRPERSQLRKQWILNRKYLLQNEHLFPRPEDAAVLLTLIPLEKSVSFQPNWSLILAKSYSSFKFQQRQDVFKESKRESRVENTCGNWLAIRCMSQTKKPDIKEHILSNITFKNKQSRPHYQLWGQFLGCSAWRFLCHCHLLFLDLDAGYRVSSFCESFPSCYDLCTFWWVYYTLIKKLKIKPICFQEVTFWT